MNSIRHVGEPSSEGQSVQRNIAARLANNSTSLPLSTIVEQCSRSTLHSHKSLHGSSGPCSLVQPSHTTQSVSASLRNSRSLDESALYRIQEHAYKAHKAYQPIDDHAHPLLDPEMQCTDSHPTAPIANITRPRQLLRASKRQEVCQDGDCKRLKGLLRGVMQHVRGGSPRGDSRSSIPKLPSTETLGASENTPSDLRLQIGEPKLSHLLSATTRDVSFFSGSASSPQLSLSETPGNVVEPNDWSSIPSDAYGCQLPAIRQVSPKRQGDNAISPHNPGRLLYHSTVHDQVHPSCYIPSETSSLLHHNIEEITSKYTFDELPIHDNNTPLIQQYDLAREPSFCSTASTSYSGTVLGVDLDLQQDSPPTAHHSSTPVWFDASAPHRSQKCVTRTRTLSSSDPPRTITSSALPVLLPLAVSSGIVKPNYATPHLSFYSPSGNLIQTERSTSSSSSTIFNQSARPPFSKPSPRPRLTVVPLITPLPSSIPLPGHLKLRHKAQCHDKSTPSRIFPQLGTTNIVKGCGGVIKQNSFASRSGVLAASLGANLRSNQSSNCRFNWSYSSSIKHIKPQLSAMAPCTSPSKKSMDKATTPSRGINETTRLAPKPRRHMHGDAHGGKAELGPFAAWALRICFCQPWDGAGANRHMRANGSQCLGDGCDDDACTAHGDMAQNVPARVISKKSQDSCSMHISYD
jgi:hypothetical protein